MENTATSDCINLYIYYTDSYNLVSFIKEQILSISNELIDIQLKISFQFGENIIVSVTTSSEKIAKITTFFNNSLTNFIKLNPSFDNAILNSDGFRFFPNNSVIIKKSIESPKVGFLIYSLKSFLDHSTLFYQYHSILLKTAFALAEATQDLFTSTLAMNIMLLNKMKLRGNSMAVIENCFLYFIESLQEYNGLLIKKSRTDIIYFKKESYSNSYNENEEGILKYSQLILQCIDENQEFEEDWLNNYNAGLNVFFENKFKTEFDFNLNTDIFAFQLLCLNNQKFNICDDQEGLMLFYIQKIWENIYDGKQ